MQENIWAFGGDPKRVLLLGDSSGASDVFLHMVSHTSEGLFTRAMMMSGAMRHGAAQSLRAAQSNFDLITERSGCRATGARVVECLQSLPADTLVGLVNRSAAFLPYPSGWSNSSWSPTVDGRVLTAQANELAQRGELCCASAPPPLPHARTHTHTHAMDTPSDEACPHIGIVSGTSDPSPHPHSLPQNNC